MLIDWEVELDEETKIAISSTRNKMTKFKKSILKPSIVEIDTNIFQIEDDNTNRISEFLPRLLSDSDSNEELFSKINENMRLKFTADEEMIELLCMFNNRPTYLDEEYFKETDELLSIARGKCESINESIEQYKPNHHYKGTLLDFGDEFYISTLLDFNGDHYTTYNKHLRKSPTELQDDIIKIIFNAILSIPDKSLQEEAVDNILKESVAMITTYCMYNKYVYKTEEDIENCLLDILNIVGNEKKTNRYTATKLTDYAEAFAGINRMGNNELWGNLGDVIDLFKLSIVVRNKLRVRIFNSNAKEGSNQIEKAIEKGTNLKTQEELAEAISECMEEDKFYTQRTHNMILAFVRNIMGMNPRDITLQNMVGKYRVANKVYYNQIRSLAQTINSGNYVKQGTGTKYTKNLVKMTERGFSLRECYLIIGMTNSLGFEQAYTDNEYNPDGNIISLIPNAVNKLEDTTNIREMLGRSAVELTIAILQ